MRSAPAVAIVLTLGMSTGCFVSTSEDPPPPRPPPAPVVRTTGAFQVGELTASMSAQGDERGLTVYASLLHDGDFLRLDPGDYFVARVGAEEQVLVPQPDPGVNKIRYFATFSQPVEATEVTVAFHRPVGLAGAPLSRVRVAGRFEVVAPPASFFSTSGLTVTLSPSPRTVEGLYADLEGPCVAPRSKIPLQATGDGRFVANTTGIARVGCTLTAHLRHESTGLVDSAFKRGSFGLPDAMEGLQVRSFVTSLVP